MTETPPEERGWSDDVETRVNRRPKQVISADEWDSGNLETTPSWYYQCQECGNAQRFHGESTFLVSDCHECKDVVTFEPLGELIYPEGDE